MVNTIVENFVGRWKFNLCSTFIRRKYFQGHGIASVEFIKCSATKRRNET